MFLFNQTVSFCLELVDLALVCDQSVSFEFLNTNTDVCVMHLTPIRIRSDSMTGLLSLCKIKSSIFCHWESKLRPPDFPLHSVLLWLNDFQSFQFLTRKTVTDMCTQLNNIHYANCT